MSATTLRHRHSPSSATGRNLPAAAGSTRSAGWPSCCSRSSGSLWFANESNAGKFWDRLPHLFDFIDQLLPRDGWEVWRALFDLPSPYDDGSLKYNYPEGRMYLTETLYIPEYIYKMVETLNIALVSTLVGFALGFCLCFLAASNLVTQRWLRFFVRRFMEVLRAFPEIVIAGFFLAVLSLGPIPAILAVVDPHGRRARKNVLRGGRERRHAARRGPARGRRQLAGARLVRHRAAGDAQFPELRAA